MHIQTRTKLKRVIGAWGLGLLASSILLSLIAPVAGQAYASSALRAVCRDTVAGYAATCSAAADPNEGVMFKVVKADGTAVRFQATADRKGIATAALNRLHTEKAGTYRVGAYPSWVKEPKDQELVFDSFNVIKDASSSASKKSILSASISGAVGGPISKFKVTAPASVKAGEAFDVKVCAVDDTDQAVNDYAGTILFFAAGDANAVLPFQNDGYTFTGTDQGACHTFAKGATLTTAGTIRLAVADVDNPDIAADTAITVTDGNSNSNGSTTGSPSPDGVSISSPTNGSTYGEATINVLGTGPKSSKITVSDGARELGSVQSDATGAFTYSAVTLSDGKHDFTAEAFDAGGVSLGKSTTVTVTINMQGATLQGLTIMPGETVAPNTPITVTVVSDPKLSRVRLVVSDIAHDLRENASTPGRYESTFAAPATAGTYDLKLSLTNALNKETVPTVDKKLIVRADEKLVIEAKAADKPGTATVTWQPPQADAEIAQYHVLYGTDQAKPEFDVKVDNKGVSALVEGLKADTTYYFSVSPIYKDGHEGILSDIVNLKTPTTSVPLINNTKAIGATRRINLTWDEPDLPATGGSSDSFNSGGIAQYVIDYSTTSDKPESQAKTGSTTPSWYVENLQECTEYFFQVTAVDASGKPLARSPVFNGKTSCGDNACQVVQVSGLHSVIEGDGSQTLYWQSVLGARGYRVYAGSVEGRADYGQWDVVDARFPIFANRFPKNAEIVFAVQALGEGSCFENAAVSNAIRTKVGPALWLVAFLTAAAGAYSVARRRKGIA